MAWAANGDFMLTEFRVEELSSTTNIALGAPVTATHPLHITGQAYSVFVQMLPSALTDGWPSTLAHPKAHGENEGFYFEIDLGQQRILDHIGLRQRGDEYNLNRFGKMRIKVYEQDPKEGATPTWQTLNRPAGTYADQGGVDILREADGEGQFRGRYIRISTESNVKGAPMLAELEVYETRTAQLAGIAMDNQPLLKDTELKIPPEIRRLGLQFEIPQTGKPYDRIYRWRVGSDDKSWQISNTLLLEIPCPPAGDHILEIQAAHSDGSWDASVLKIPITVDARFTQTQAFLWLIVGATLLVGMLSTRYFSRQKIKQLQASSAIETERSRIAMNMHDDVGARLAQLAVLQDVFALEHQLPNAAKTDLSAMTSNIRETMASLNEAVWAVNPRNNTLTALATFLMQYADAYLSPLGITCRVISPNEWQYIKLRAGIRHEVALTFKEALQNIVKHADASEVEVALRQDGKQFIVRVTDNGCGLPEEEAGPGHYGLKNMSRRLNDIGGSCEWLPREPSGTIVEMKLPLT
ncbi:MAG: ATP-binding protein [Akkermansiaceae bacterium]